jgi:hypothetical protein
VLEIAHYLYDNKYVMIKISEKIANIRNRLNLLLENPAPELLDEEGWDEFKQKLKKFGIDLNLQRGEGEIISTGIIPFENKTARFLKIQIIGYYTDKTRAVITGILCFDPISTDQFSIKLNSRNDIHNFIQTIKNYIAK